MSKSQEKKPKKHFYCPLGSTVLWWHNLIYKDCPLVPSHRDMPECKDCQLRIDKQWEDNKETWKDKPVKRKKKRPRNNKKGSKK